MLLMFTVCVLVFLYTCYLVTRCRMPRIPEQIGQYGPGVGLGIGVLMANSLLLTFAVWAALEKAVIPWAVAVLLPGMYCWLVNRKLFAAAFSEKLLAVRGLFGAPSYYRWTDVQDCTIYHDEGRGRYNYPHDVYSLILPDRVVRISNSEDAGRALLQVLECNRPDLMRSIQL